MGPVIIDKLDDLTYLLRPVIPVFGSKVAALTSITGSALTVFFRK